MGPLKWIKTAAFSAKYYFAIPLLKNDKLKELLNTQVHSVEKDLVEGTSNFVKTLLARSLYIESEKRKILSPEDTKWCERVLLGAQDRQMNSEDGNELINIMKARRSVRSWQQGKTLKDEDFEQIANSVRWAPSSCNRQTCELLLVTDQEKIVTLAKLRGQEFVRNAPCCIVILVNMSAYNTIESKYTPYLDAGVAIQNVLLTAHSLGLGACVVNFGPHEITEDKVRKTKQIFNIPTHYKVAGIIPIGYPKIVPYPPGRRKLSEIIHKESFE